MQVKCNDLTSAGACNACWLYDSLLVTLTFAVGDWIVFAFPLIPLKNLSRFSFDSHCYCFFFNRKTFKDAF